jgi:hypothetical protein
MKYEKYMPREQDVEFSMLKNVVRINPRGFEGIKKEFKTAWTIKNLRNLKN